MSISVLDFIEMGDYIDAFAVSNGETIYGADVHKQQLCQRGMRRCELCDNFEIVTVSCEMKNNGGVTDAVLNQISESNNWAIELESLREQQISNTCNTLIDFIESKNIRSIIFITSVSTKPDESGREKVFGEILVPKTSKLKIINILTKMSQKSMKTDSFPVNRMTFIESMKTIFVSSEGTLIKKLENLWDELEAVYDTALH